MDIRDDIKTQCVPSFNPLHWWEWRLRRVRLTGEDFKFHQKPFIIQWPFKILSWVLWGKDFSSPSYLQVAENLKPVLSLECHGKCGFSFLVPVLSGMPGSPDERDKVTGKVKQERAVEISSIQHFITFLVTLNGAGKINSHPGIKVWLSNTIMRTGLDTGIQYLKVVLKF